MLGQETRPAKAVAKSKGKKGKEAEESVQEMLSEIREELTTSFQDALTKRKLYTAYYRLLNAYYGIYSLRLIYSI